MSTYKGFSYYYNDLQNKWLLLSGGEFIQGYDTLKGLKCAVSVKWSK